MPFRDLRVIAGELARGKKPQVPRDAIARRWRTSAPEIRLPDGSDVIPLLDGWIRRLEREAGTDSPVDAR